MAMGPMHMYVYFDETCAFVFKQFKTVVGDYGYFVLGCFCCLLYGIFHMLIPFLKDLYLKKKLKNSNQKYSRCPIDVKIILTIYYFAYTLSNFMLMMIMMTMNGWVLIATALGLTIGYFIFTFDKTLYELKGNHELCHS
ncbi:Ctr copper transporter family protein (macronuclear) [Tetrahymena thermophila SB210]|uniref:Copper transport protein n=1 Tax=Tetrahymena thermophila (strain SB210) TaxID=312017 RepID=I7MJ46_TETTS|nr:Ctr copper transporter family protein [Tetrahymena thermophila SB210]EAR95950.2 Ctr copper transporter family protein [Tetrahymena thermophila SB210]|eukprot:XP_001016195.2 Ctr copper transporter family protein [Tetrahymena thermophila SB210]